MEPSSIPAPAPPPPAPPAAAVPFPAEPIPEPPPPTHPPYPQMIYTAIEALKEKNGSTKRAISKYIEQVYKEQLPPNHSTLLTQHLTRLKSDGILQMNKNSYIIPRSAPGTGLGLAVQPSDSPSPRPRGRPRKAQTLPLPSQDISLSAQDASIPGQDVANLSIQQNAEPVWAALGLADEPVQVEGTKKRRGRPKKSDKPGSGSGRRGRPPGSGKKADAVATDGSSAVPTGPKRGPGRPPKNTTQATPIPFAPVAPAAAAAGAEGVVEQDGNAAVAGAGAGVDAGVVLLGPRSRGRPKKYADEIAAAGRGRGRGRGRGGGGRGRGRGRRGGLMPVPVLLRKPLGRPKGSTSANSSKKVATDLRSKLEHFQSKVKEALAVLKPHFNHESPVTAIAAIQDLEELGTMDLNEPLRDEAPPQQEEVPPPQPPLAKPPSPLQAHPPQPQQPLQQPPQQPITQQLLQPSQTYPQNFPPFHQQPPQFHQQPLPFQQSQFPQQPQPQTQPQTQQLFQSQPPHHQQFHP